MKIKFYFDTQKCLIYILITASFSAVLCFNHINEINLMSLIVVTWKGTFLLAPHSPAHEIKELRSLSDPIWIPPYRTFMFRFINYRFPFRRFICFSQLIWDLNNFSIKSQQTWISTASIRLLCAWFSLSTPYLQKEDEVLMKYKRFLKIELPLIILRHDKIIGVALDEMTFFN